MIEEKRWIQILVWILNVCKLESLYENRYSLNNAISVHIFPQNMFILYSY